MALRFGEPAPVEFWKWKIARETGWNLEYINSLTLSDLSEYWSVLEAESKAANAARGKSSPRRAK